MDEYTSRRRIWELTCPGLPEEVGRVRRWTRDVLGDSRCAEEAALIVSELSTNALMHSASGTASGSMRISLFRTSGSVVLAVTDIGGGRTKPHAVAATEGDTHGRGLTLVSSLGRRMEVSGDDEGYTVMVELDPGTTEPEARPAASLRPSTRGQRR
ncbi:ATP-binding protein [Streptomyces phytophilus]|uniref:ATP-binding protein n=1 Tax=Streptomyces phytophilus TaxID=722715 RepID=UPI0015F11F58|nr:ATP-binding protein [Streptomyces phytophilus]